MDHTCESCGAKTSQPHFSVYPYALLCATCSQLTLIQLVWRLLDNGIVVHPDRFPAMNLP